MNTDLSPEATTFGQTALRAIEAAGGDDLARTIEANPAGRERLVEDTLGTVGAWDLTPRVDEDEMEAAAALCRSAGYWSLPYPVAERLAKPNDKNTDGLVVVSERSPAGQLAGSSLRWTAVTLDGERHTVRIVPDERGPRASAFVVPLKLRVLDSNGVDDLALALVLPCWTLLGMIDRALEMTREYVIGREQFGKNLASFQGVQFQLTDAEVERLTLGELAKYALWSSLHRPADAIDDALALRTSAIGAADIVFRVAHQLHGAIGFCDETTLSWLSRYSQPLRRLPFGLSGTRDRLTTRLGRRGLSGLFDADAGDLDPHMV